MRLFHIFLFVFLNGLISAQNIYWADEVVNFSSQLGDRYYSANQALGVPNAISEKEMSQWAWLPKTERGGKEYIRVRFKNGTKGVRQVYVSESRNHGGITKITLHDTKGKKHVVYQNKNPKPLGHFDIFRMFLTEFSPIDAYVNECTIEINTKAVSGVNIDAIGLSTQQGRIKIKGLINNIQYANPVPKPENLGRQINSNYAERLPIISPDGKTLYFTRKFHPENMGKENYDDIWVSQRLPNETWSFPKNIGTPLNTDNHNFVIAVNPTGTALYLGNKYHSFEEGISVSYLKNGTWSKPKDMKITNHYNDNKFVEYHVSVDEQVLLMSVQRDEGYGKRDIYVSFRKGNRSWTRPKNLGATINTVNVESSVFLAADGKTLYFSSNGHYNHGGLDVFMSKRLDDSWTKWSEPQNLGAKINTIGNDYNYTIPASGEYAYFSSDDFSYGMSDLFRMKLPKEAQPEPVMLLTGKIIDATTNQPIKAKVKYNSLDKNRTDNNETNAQEDGNYQVVLPYGKNMEVYADIEGYFPVSQSMELSNETIEELDSDSPNDPLLKINNEDSYTKEESKLEQRIKQLEQELSQLKKNKTQAKKRTVPYQKGKIKTRPTSSFKQKNKPRSKDPKLDRLKEKYYANLNQKKYTPPSKPAEKNNKEVSDMYAKLYGKKNKQTQDQPSSKPTSEPIKKNENIVETPPHSSTIDNTEKEPTFEEIEEETREELRQQFLALVKAELKEELADEVKQDLEKESGNEMVFNTVTEEVKQESRNTLTELSQLKGEVYAHDNIKLELEKILVAEVKSELKEELQEEVKAELKNEISLRVKTKERDEAQKKYDAYKERRKKAKNQKNSLPNPTESNPKPEYAEVNKNIKVVPIKVGQVIPMNNIFFDANKSTLKSQSSSELERVLAFLKKNNQLVVEVGGHTNGWCSSSFADQLSTDRARKVRNYFIENGIPENRIQYAGYGKQVPIATNKTLTGRKKNQRVELKVLEILE